MNCTGKNCVMQYGKVDPATCKAVEYCPQATPPKTNADRIRSMSDDELADFIHMIFMRGYSGAFPAEWIGWLQQEVKE